MGTGKLQQSVKMAVRSLRRSLGSYPVLSILRATRGFSSKPPPLSVAMANAQTMIGTKRDDELVHKRMVSKLQEEGYTSPLMERISQKVDVGSQVAEQEQELLQEIAQALKRTENKLLFACLELEVAGKRADLLASQKDPQLQDAVETHNKARERAVKRRHDLTVQRQACGFRTNSFTIMDELYPIPPRRLHDNSALSAPTGSELHATRKKSELVSWRIGQLDKEEWAVFHSKPRLERHAYILELLDLDEQRSRDRPAELLNRAPTAKDLEPKLPGLGVSPGRVIL